MMHARCLCIAVAMSIAGCAPVVEAPASSLTAPKAAWMVAPQPLPEVKANDDGFKSDTQCSAAYVTETKKLAALQGWVTTVLRKK